MSDGGEGPVRVGGWLEAQARSFLGPVANKLMHGAGQLKVMFVRGPNERTDFHIEEGEELFYMLQGDMELVVMERGARKVVTIREGEWFLLPPRIPHSPQRRAGTMGIVFERERLEREMDGMRWYVAGAVVPRILHEEWFHCTDLGTQLPPVISRFHASHAKATNEPEVDYERDRPSPVLVDAEAILPSPATLRPPAKGSPAATAHTLVGGDGCEFALVAVDGRTGEAVAGASSAADGDGDDVLWTLPPHGVEEIFLWQKRGESRVWVRESGDGASSDHGQGLFPDESLLLVLPKPHDHHHPSSHSERHSVTLRIRTTPGSRLLLIYNRVSPPPAPRSSDPGCE
jgi:3-hydroxyanthranilate 3,4-dioxygenase